jgi:hypothetical protein
MAEEATAKTSLSPCYHWNSRTGPNLSGLDPESGALVRLFHPRQDRWDEHFERNGVLIVGSQCGRPSDGRLVEDTEDLQRPLFRFFLLALYCGVEST